MKLIPLLVFIPVISWVIMIFVSHFVDDAFSETCIHSGFGMWLSSLLTAYAFCLYREWIK